MKKILLCSVLFLQFFLPTSSPFVHADDSPGYSIEEALRDSLKNTTEHRASDSQSDIRTQEVRDARPVHLVGVNDELRGDTSDITTYLQRFASGIITIAGILAVIVLLWNSANLIMSLGNPDAVTTSKKGIAWSLIGLVVMMMAFVVVRTAIQITYVADGPANDYRGLAVSDNLDLCLDTSTNIIETNLENLKSIDLILEEMYLNKEETEFELSDAETYYIGDNDPTTPANRIKSNKQKKAQELLRDIKKQLTDISVLIQSSEKDRTLIYDQISRTLLNCGTYKEPTEVELLDTYTEKIDAINNRLEDTKTALEKAQKNKKALFDLPTV